MADDSTRTAPLDDPSDASTSGPRAAGNTASAAAADPLDVRPDPPPGYELFDEVGRGGMGVVYRARDAKLNRDVAVKFLRPRFPADGIEARRFVQEAQITAQLTHPGVPPVHEVGAHADGRPFLVMKLVAGQTLQRLVRRAEPPDRARLLAVFERICETVGFAHSRGFIHRDLKPANVMVGEFGEVQVMDWGLARARKDEGGRMRDEERAAASGSSSSLIPHPSSLLTEAGSVLGTPAYMSPEQAGGEVEKIDARTDVFGLGAVLCAILTGQPPYVADADAALALLALRGDLTGAQERLRASAASPEVAALCLRCLSPERDDRPPDANAVAAAVAALRTAAEDRARRAELDRVRLDAELREQRQKRRVRLIVGAVCAAFVAAAIGVAWWADRKNSKHDADVREGQLREQIIAERLETERRERLARNAGTVAALLTECETDIRAANLPIAGAVLGQAERLAAEGGTEHLAARLARCRADLSLLHDLDKLDGRWPATAKPRVGKRATEEIPAALARYGINPGTTPLNDMVARVNDSLVREHLLTALDQWLEWQPSADVQALLKAVDSDPFRDAVRDAHRRRDGHAVDVLAGTPAALDQPARYAAVLGDTLVVPPPRRRQLLLAALERNPGDYRLLMTLGYLWLVESPGASHEYERWFRAAVAVRPSSPIAHNYLGVALLGYDSEAAIREFREAVRLYPDFPGALNNLGSALINRGHLAEAIAVLEGASKCRPPYNLTFANLGVAYEQWGDPVGAARAFGEWLALTPDDAAMHNRLAWLLATTHDADARDGRKAVAHATRACELGAHKDGNHIDTLAAALAAVGEFERAAAEQKRALAMPAFERRYGPAARARLALYEKGQSYIQPPRRPVAPMPRAK